MLIEQYQVLCDFFPYCVCTCFNRSISVVYRKTGDTYEMGIKRAKITHRLTLVPSGCDRTYKVHCKKIELKIRMFFLRGSLF